jgi:hypothetical protein
VIIKHLFQVESDKRKIRPKKMAASELLIASRRLEALVECGLISRKEKSNWDRRIDGNKVSLAEVERFAAKKRGWSSKQT